MTFAPQSSQFDDFRSPGSATYGTEAVFQKQLNCGTSCGKIMVLGGAAEGVKITARVMEARESSQTKI